MKKKYANPSRQKSDSGHASSEIHSEDLVFVHDTIQKLGPGPAFFQMGFRAFYRLFETLGFIPGLEFVVAMEEAERLNIPIVFGDQAFDKTLANIWKCLPELGMQLIMPKKMSMKPEEIWENDPPPYGFMEFFHRLNQPQNDPVLEAWLERLKTRSKARKMANALREFSPCLHSALLSDRDKIMATNLRQTPGTRIVAVVGLAHLDGMIQHLDSLTQTRVLP